MIWVTARVAHDDVTRVASFLTPYDLSYYLEELNLAGSNLLASHWFWPAFDADCVVTEQRMDVMAECGLLGDRRGIVQVEESKKIVGELTFVRGDACELETVAGRSLLAIHTRRSGRYLWISGTCADGDLRLVDQTKSIMPGIGEALSRQGMDFANVVKSTTHYVGTASPVDLHENLAVRHSFYSSPGPASTGLPVAGLRDEGARIAIDVLAIAGD